MKRNLYKIAMASVGALALGIQSPAFASDPTDSTTAQGTITEVTTIEITDSSGTFQLEYTGGANEKLSASTTISYATNAYNKKIVISSSSITIPANAGTYQAVIGISGGTATYGTAISNAAAATWGDLSSSSSTATAADVTLAQGTVVTNAVLTVTLTRTGGGRMTASTENAYRVPVTLTVTNAS